MAVFKGSPQSFKRLHKSGNDCDWFTFKDGDVVIEELVELVRAQGGEFVSVEEAPKPSDNDKRVQDFKADLADDGKRNFSNDNTKKSPGRKKKGRKK